METIFIYSTDDTPCPPPCPLPPQPAPLPAPLSPPLPHLSEGVCGEEVVHHADDGGPLGVRDPVKDLVDLVRVSNWETNQLGQH